MAAATANAAPAKPETITPSNPDFPTRGHQRARSVSTGDESSPNSFVFPRKSPLPHNTRPRSGTTDAITLLAEIGVLPPPGTAAAARLRSPPTPYYPNRQRPQSMLVLPSPALPPVTLAPAPAGRAHKRGTSDLPGVEKPVVAPIVPKDASNEEEPLAKKPSGPPPGYQRRGHAHRRSGAISSSDVWSLLSQSTPSLPLQNGALAPKANQPPTTPELKPESTLPRPNHVPRQSWSAPVSPAVGALAIPPPSPTPLDLDKKSSKVAFTERVEIIPRPLSTASTIRASSGSMSSTGDFGSPLVRSLAAPVTPATPATPAMPATPAAPAGRPRSNTRNRSSSISSSQSPLSPELQAQFAHITQRPNTAGAILSPPIPLIPMEPVPPVPALLIEPVSEPQSPTTSSYTDIPQSPTRCFAPEKLERMTRKKSHKKALSDGSPQTSSPSSPDLFGKATENDDEASQKTKKGDKRKKKQLKNFLFGKSVLGKHNKTGKHGRPLKRSPTPPSRQNSFRRQAGDMELPPAWTESYVIMPEGSMAGRSLEELSSTMSPRYPGSGSDRDSPVIDLDAAMGPFNSPVVGSGTKSSSGGFSAAKRRMHSSGAGGKMSIVSGVIGTSFIGTHRRSESMPEMGMPLFDLAEHASMEMEDVFEEEEEEEEEDSSSGSDSGSETDESEDGDRQRRMSTGGLGIGIQVTDGDGITTWEQGMSMWDNVPRGPRRSSLAPTLGSNSSLRNVSIQEEDEPEEDTAGTTPASIFSHSNDSAKSQSPSPDSCSTPTSFGTSAQSSTSTVTPISAVSNTTFPLSDTPATSCPTESFSMSMPLPSPPFAAPRTASPSSRRNSLTLKELVDLSLQEGNDFDPYAGSEFRFLGEPGPEMRMSVSVDDVPSLTSSSSTMTSSYAAYCAAGILQQPSTPKIEEIPVGVVGAGAELHVDGKGKHKGLKKKWSRVFKFWESDEKKPRDKEKEKEKEKDGGGGKEDHPQLKEKHKEDKVHSRKEKEDKAHKKDKKDKGKLAGKDKEGSRIRERI